MGVPAVPATLDFRMHLQKADGGALTSKWYRITWGRGDPLPLAQTNANGLVEAELDARYTWGVLEVGDNDPAIADDKGFVPHISIDLRLVKPPGAAKKHPRKKLDPEQDSPPEPKPKAKPGATPAQEPGDSGEPGPAQPDPTLISMPPNKSQPDWDPKGRYPKADKKPAEATEAPAETERRLERLDRMTADLHEKRTKVYELTWRLHNLGFLGFWSGHLTFPIDGGKYAEILDAMNRYAFKHGLTLLKEEDMSAADSTLDAIMAHVTFTHDNAQIIAP